MQASRGLLADAFAGGWVAEGVAGFVVAARDGVGEALGSTGADPLGEATEGWEADEAEPGALALRLAKAALAAAALAGLSVGLTAAMVLVGADAVVSVGAEFVALAVAVMLSVVPDAMVLVGSGVLTVAVTVATDALGSVAIGSGEELFVNQ